MDQVSTTLADESFRRAFRPRSVAILDASNDPARISGRALHYMLKVGYDGVIYPVNNWRDIVQGIAAFSPFQKCLPPALAYSVSYSSRCSATC